MAGICTLDNFLSNTKYEVDSENNLLHKGKQEEKIVAKNHINIKNIWYESFNAKGVILAVDYASPNGTIRDSIEIHRAYTGQRITCKWEELNAVIAPDIKKGNLTAICALYKRYFCYCINEYIKNNPAALADCGWLKENGKSIFISVNDTWNERRKIKDDFFNGMKSADIFKQELSAQRYGKFFQFLSASPGALTVFSYSVHAVLWNFLHGYRTENFEPTMLNTDTIQFSLCVHGSDVNLSKAAVNLLANLFLVKHNHWTIIDTNYHISASAISEAKYGKLPKYKSVPIIFTTRNNDFTRANSMLKKVQKQRECGRMHIYPVYISKMPVRADEILNCCTDSMAVQIPLSDKEWMYHIHLNFCVLIYQFIEYLTGLSDSACLSGQAEINEMNYILYRLLDSEELSAEWMESHTPEILLYASMGAFGHFLKQTPLSVYADDLERDCGNAFLPMKRSAPKKRLVSMPVQDTFIKDFCTFIHESLKKKSNSSWILEGEEKRGKESCYYFYPQEGYPHYTEFMKKHHLPVVSKRQLGQKLKDSGVLKCPSTGTSITLKRTERGIYVYVIKRDSLENYQAPDPFEAFF